MRRGATSPFQMFPSRARPRTFGCVSIEFLSTLLRSRFGNTHRVDCETSSSSNFTILSAEHVDETSATLTAASQPSSPAASDHSMAEDYTEPSTSTINKPHKVTYAKWSKEEQRLLVQMWCDHMTTSRSDKPKWKEIAARLSVKRKITGPQCQRKMKYLRDLYKEAKTYNEKHINQPWEDRETSPYYHEIDSVLTCRDVPHFNHVEEASTSTANHILASGATEVGPTANVSDVSVVPMFVPPRVFVGNPEESGGNSSFSTPARLAYWSKINRPADTEDDLSGVQRAASSSPENKERRKRRKKNQDNSEDNDSTVFRETMEQLQAQGERIATVMESMLKTQNQQFEMMTNFMNNFIQHIQRQKPKED